MSQDHLDARRRQIITAAQRCFAAQGFHATSMQDVFRESGLSAGAVYRYFPSKTALVRTIAGEVLDELTAELDRAAADRGDRRAAEVLGEAVRRRFAGGDLGGLRPMMLQVWAEAVRDQDLREFAREAYARIAAALAGLIAHDVAAGTLPEGVDCEAAAETLLAVVQGFVVQGSIVGEARLTALPAAIETVIAGVTARS
ncbi:TetR/AcrR family transcriptional regulator [Bailinhaonella thermotolerans]|uniref:TetR/AcrR family transcriptional regulator n=1 Tax=Bailinhaonella thermotolerans TaxID=1070861 RepID=UPI0011C35E10|nr:TetR/AcrR family transcriptional regulator [Bailinhaonella thermotolerans]